MERYRNFVRMEEMRNLLSDGNYTKALEIAKTIEMRKLKKSSEVNLLYNVYMRNGEYEQAKQCVDRLYKKAHTRKILIQLIEVSLKLREEDEAEKYYREFAQTAPDDFYVHIFRYNIDKMKGKPITELIPTLEALKAQEYIDSWAYELAKLYHKAGMKDKCIKECNDIIVWFGAGDIVDRAEALRAYYMGELELESDEKEASSDEVTEVTAANDDADNTDVEEEISASTDTSDEVTIGTDSAEVITENIDTDEEVTESTDIAIEEITSTDTEIEEIAGTDEVTSEENRYDKDETTAEDTIEIKDIVASDEASEEPVEDENLSLDLASFVNSVIDDDLSDREKAEIEVEAALKEMIDEELRLSKEADVQNVPEDECNTENEDENNIPEEVTEEVPVEVTEEVTEDVPADVTADVTAEASEEVSADVDIIDYKALFADVVFPEEGTAFRNFLDSGEYNPAEFFGGLIYIASIRSQIYKCLEVLLNPQYKPKSLSVSGFEKCSKSPVIRGIIKVLYLADILNEQKIAKSDGKRLNNIDLSAKLVQIARCGLLVEKAGGINATTAASLKNFRDIYGPQAIIVIDDTRSEINRIFREYADLGNSFINRIHIPKLTSEELYTLALWEFCAEGLDIDNAAAGKLKSLVDTAAETLEEECLTSVYNLTASVIDSVQTKNAKLLLANAKSGNFENNGIKLITVEDFEG